MGLPKPLPSTRLTGSISTAGNAVITAPSSLCATSPEGHTTIRTSIPGRNQAHFRYAQARPPCRPRCFLGQAHAAWLFPFHPRIVPFPQKWGIMAAHPPNPKYGPKPYEQMGYRNLIWKVEDSYEQRKSHSTVYRHLFNMEHLGYVKCRLVDGLASTYFITDSGKSFCKAQI